MHMSSASPWGQPLGQPQEICGRIQGDGWDSLPEGRGWANSQVFKTTGRQPQGNLAIKKPHFKHWNSFAAISGLGGPLKREEAGRKVTTKVQLAELILLILNSSFHTVIFPNEGISH